MLEPREIVKRAIEFRCPPRLPLMARGNFGLCMD